MAEHTKLPWRFSPWHVEEGPSAVRTGSDYPEDFIICTTASDADAAFIVKAVNAHEALVDLATKITKMHPLAVSDELRVQAFKALAFTSADGRSVGGEK